MEETHEREKEVNKFESSKLGVKGLVDSGITRIPLIFHHPPATFISELDQNPTCHSIPVIDLLGTPRVEVVDKIREASGKFGFFQVVNHGVPLALLGRVLDKIKGFHELPGEEKKKYYGRDSSSGCNYLSNVDLRVSKAASWRDTLRITLGPSIVKLDAIPNICRDEVIEWDKEVKQLGDLLLGLFSEGLGASVDRLKDLSCLESRNMVGQYYAYCPEPDKTLGMPSHSDPSIFTVLLQDQAGGLQVKHEGKWVDVKPVDGSLIINVGDLLQILSNGKYTSADHRVVANALQQPRVSAGVFFNPAIEDNLYGPLPELISLHEPAHYRQFTFSEFITRFFTKKLDGKTLTNFFRLESE